MKRFPADHKKNIFLAIAVGIMLFMHLFRLIEVPYGLYTDEAGAAYDAYCISRYGVDRWLMRYPVYFMNYGDGQNALNTYIIAVLFKIFKNGNARFFARIPITAAALIAAVFGYLFMKDERQDLKSRIWLILYAIMPVFIMTQRYGVESHLLLCATAVIFYFTTYAFRSDSWKRYFLLGGVMGVALYTYALSYIVIPIYLCGLLIYMIVLKKWRWKNIISLAIPLGILAFPLILVQIVNIFQLPSMHLGPFTVPRLYSYRSNELDLTLKTMWDNLALILKNTLLFDELPYNTLSKFGTLYYISLPFLAVGVVRALREAAVSCRERVYSPSVPVLLWTVGEVIMGVLLTGHSKPNSTRMIGIFIPLLYYVVLGLYQIYQWLGQNIRKIYVVGCALIYSVCFLCFAGYYFTEYNSDAFPMNWLFYEPYEEVRDFLEENSEEEWTQMTIWYPWNYVYYLLSYRINPYDMNLPENGKMRYQKDVINEYVGVEDIRSNYVTLKPPGNPSTDIYLASRKYVRYDIGDKFYFNLSPLGFYAETRNDTDAVVYLDHVTAEDENFRLYGWCVDNETDKTYKNFRFSVDGAKEFPVDVVDREDVVKVFNKPEYIMSGFEVIVPMDVFCDSDNLRLIGITDEGREVELIIWEKTESEPVKGGVRREVTEKL